MDPIAHVTEGDAIRAPWANALADVANAVLSGTGVNGVIVENGSVRLIRPMTSGQGGTIVPAFNVGTDPLRAGSICLVRRSRLIEIDAAVGRGQFGISVNVSKFKLVDSASQIFAIVLSGMDGNPGGDIGSGLQGSVLLEGIAWVRGKLEDAWDPADGVEPIYRGLNPVEDELFGYIVQDGLWEIVAEEQTGAGTPIAARTEEHWIAIRFGAPRYPMLFEAVDDEETAKERIKVQMVKQDGTLVDDYDFFFSTLQD